MTASFAVVGGGLAGCECALALARAGLACVLYEQKPEAFSPAHASPDLAELVCSNSFRSNDPLLSAVGLLKREMRDLGSAVMAEAEATAVPAGKALAVDRALFGARMTRRIENEPLIRLVRRPVHSLDDPELAGKTIIVAAGPLASASLAASLAGVIGAASLYFYDAIAPILAADSVDMNVAFRASRYGNDAPPPYLDGAPMRPAGCAEGERGSAPRPAGEHDAPQTPANTETAGDEAESGDYLNCPMTRQEYEAFYQALRGAETVPAHDFEEEIHFEGCMPVEALAARGEKTLTFGPLKPVGFTDPRTGRRPYAVLQLRAENAARSAYNLVGCQTKMTYAEQARVFRLAPGLERAEFLRFGSVHRNTYVDAPACLNADLSLRARPGVFLAGQISGVEGYVESAASGLWLGLWLAARAQGRILDLPPATTALGALLGHLRTPAKRFQPSNVHFGLMPEPQEKPGKKARKAVLAERALADFTAWRQGMGI